MHKTIKKVTEDVEAFKFNTAVAALMEFVNGLGAHLETHGPTPAFDEAAEILIRLLAPFAPHIAEELWARRGGAFSVHEQPWPAYDPALTMDEVAILVIQVNGKVRDRIQVSAAIGDEAAQALASERVRRYRTAGRPSRWSSFREDWSTLSSESKKSRVHKRCPALLPHKEEKGVSVVYTNSPEEQ